MDVHTWTYHGEGSFAGVSRDNYAEFYRTDNDIGIIRRTIVLPVGTNRAAWHAMNDADLLDDADEGCVSARADTSVYYYKVDDTHRTRIALILIQFGQTAKSFSVVDESGAMKFFDNLPMVRTVPEYRIEDVIAIHDPRFGVVTMRPPLYIGANTDATLDLTAKLTAMTAERDKYRDLVMKFRGMISDAVDVSDTNKPAKSSPQMIVANKPVKPVNAAPIHNDSKKSVKAFDW